MKLRSLCFCALLIAACGDPDGKLNADPNAVPNNATNNTNNVPSCTFDGDCGDGEACEGTVCVATCVSDADCAAGEICDGAVNTTELVCQTIDGPLNNPPLNNPPNNRNLYYSVQIQSTTTAPDACFVEDPGPDIFGVGLEDSTGSVLAWGVVDWDQITLDGNAFTDTSVIDGNGPDLSSDVCPDMFDGNIVALGCDVESWIIVSFVDASAQPVALDATGDQVIRVYEWGGQCTTGSIDDTYNVSICTDTAGARGGDDSSCTIQVIVDGAGETSGEVGGF